MTASVLMSPVRPLISPASGLSSPVCPRMVREHAIPLTGLISGLTGLISTLTGLASTLITSARWPKSSARPSSKLRRT